MGSKSYLRIGVPSTIIAMIAVAVSIWLSDALQERAKKALVEDFRRLPSLVHDYLDAAIVRDRDGAMCLPEGEHIVLMVDSKCGMWTGDGGLNGRITIAAMKCKKSDENQRGSIHLDFRCSPKRRAWIFDCCYADFSGKPVPLYPGTDGSDWRWVIAWAIKGIRESKGIHAYGPEVEGHELKSLIDALKNDVPNRRQCVARTLRWIGGSRVGTALIAALKDRDPGVRATTVESLGQIRDTRVFAPAIDLLKDDNPNVREAAASAISRVPDKCAVEPLIIALKDKEPAVRAAAAWALCEIPDGRAFEPLMAVLTDASPDVRRAATAALGPLKDGRAVDPLVLALRDKDFMTREMAARALGRIGDARAVGALDVALSDANPMVRWAAASALGKIGDRRAISSLIAVLGDDDSHTGERAAQALQKMTGLNKDNASWADWWKEQGQGGSSKSQTAEESTTRAAQLMRIYVVEPGDTLWRIAQKVYGDGQKVHVIEQANPEWRSRLQVGARLRIPPNPGETKDRIRP